MTIQEATYFLLNKLRAVYPDSEASQITDWVMEHITGSHKAERMIYKNEEITANEELKLQQITARLLRNEPVQYVLQEAWFCGMKLYVDNNALIPRPETEELVEWLLKEVGNKRNEPLSILDVGTGSGCIPIALKRSLRNAEIWSCDVSEPALDVARKNADTFAMTIQFVRLDFLDQHQRTQLPSFDFIVSNPPYVPEKDKEQMQPNVLEYEPHAALFVPNNDAFIFYRAFAEFGHTHLNPGGKIMAEIYENRSDEVSAVFTDARYLTTLRNDMQGKQRMMMATR